MKKLHLIKAIIIILILGSTFLSIVRERTVEDAIRQTGRQVIEIFHEEEIMDGKVVFFSKSIKAGSDYTIAAGYIKKTSLGWEWVYGGEHSHPDQPISSQYFPKTQNTPFPLAFGEVSDPEIVQVSVKTEARTLKKEVRIIQNGTTRIWFVFLNSSDGTILQVNGLSQNGQTLFSNDFSL